MANTQIQGEHMADRVWISKAAGAGAVVSTARTVLHRGQRTISDPGGRRSMAWQVGQAIITDTVFPLGPRTDESVPLR